MSNNQNIFQKLIDKGNPVGEVVSVDKFLIKIKGLHPVQVQALVMFEDGSKGIVRQIDEQTVSVLHLGNETINIGSLAVIQSQELITKVGKGYIGRVVSVMGQPLDGKGPIATDSEWPVFSSAPPLWSRKLLDKQLESGVMTIDSILPIVRGQRIAILGDSKSGKTTLATQLAINQKNTDQIVVYCMIAKKRTDIDTLLSKLEATGSMESAIVIVSTIFDSIVMSYLAPYMAVSIAEYLWQKCNQDVIIIYDDMTAHAHAYREIALLSGVSPGRDSYPGDMFFAHSSLLERAGRLASNGNCLTSVPIVLAAGGDITAYLPTNIMSITDGQWILDMGIFKSGIRPAVDIGLSVTRVGGVGHNKRQKDIASSILKILAHYRQAEEFSHFGSELALVSKMVLKQGRNIFSLLNQGPTDVYNLKAQQLMLDIAISTKFTENLDATKLEELATEYSKKIKKDEDFEKVRDELRSKVLVEIKE